MEVITEKEYPIRNIWLFKRFFCAILILFVYFLFSIFVGDGSLVSANVIFVMFPLFLIILFLLVAPFIIDLLQRMNFHYSFDEHFVTLHQGIISKKNRNVPYGRIQGVFVSQKLFDRIFGLASLTFEDFSQGGQSYMDADGYTGGKSRREVIGFMGNKIHIPGLKKEDAEKLKSIILQKIKESPIEDGQSGL